MPQKEVFNINEIVEKIITVFNINEIVEKIITMVESELVGRKINLICLCR